ncbi:MAG: hypothetical protein R3C19_22875 [Planctomycetaceae bacterium]
MIVINGHRKPVDIQSSAELEHSKVLECGDWSPLWNSFSQPSRMIVRNGHRKPVEIQSSGESERSRELAERISRLNSLQIAEVERLVTSLELQSRRDTSSSRRQHSHWPHAPLHRLGGKGTYIVTAGTFGKEHHFCSAESLQLLQAELLAKARQYDWQLEAWACFSNHYHFVGHALEDSASLKPFLAHFHADSAREINRRQGCRNRRVWYNFWETELTYEKSYLARLNYVHQNAVRHGLVSVANQYRWCSAAWFERTATPAQVKTIYGFKTDKLKVLDDFEVLSAG